MNLFAIYLAIGACLYCLDQFLKYSIQKRDAAEDFKKVTAVIDEAPSEWGTWLWFVAIAAQFTVYSLLWPRYATRSLLNAIKYRNDEDDDDDDDDDDSDDDDEGGHGTSDDSDETEGARELCTVRARIQIARRAHSVSRRAVCRCNARARRTDAGHFQRQGRRDQLMRPRGARLMVRQGRWRKASAEKRHSSETVSQS